MPTMDSMRSRVPLLKISLVSVFYTGSTAATPSAEELFKHWESGELEAAWAMVEEVRSTPEYDAAWKLYAAISADYGLGTYRDTYDAKRLYEAALLSGESRARTALVDLLQGIDTEDQEDARQLIGLRTVLQMEPDGERLKRIGPFQFGLPSARLQNLSQAFDLNRKAALKTKNAWAIFNTSALMAFNPRGNARTRMEQEAVWLQRARSAGAAPLLSMDGFYAQLGIGRKADPDAAVEAYEAAAALGYADSQWEMGKRLIAGKGVEQDIPHGLELMHAGARGNASRLADLAEYLHEGEKVPKDIRSAKRYYEAAVAEGDAHGASELGRFYQFGWAGTPESRDKALQYYRISANRGAYWGQYNLATLLLSDHPTTEERAEAEFWMELAALDGHREAIEQILKWSIEKAKESAQAHKTGKRWARWAIAHEVDAGIPSYLSLLMRDRPIDYDEIERLARLSLATESPFPGLLALKLILQSPDAVANHEEVLKLVREQTRRSPQARKFFFSSFLGMYGSDHFDPAEISQTLREFRSDPEQLDDAVITALLLFPELSQEPLDDLKFFLSALSEESSWWKKNLPSLDDAMSMEDAFSLIAKHLAPLEMDKNARHPYTLNGRKLQNQFELNPPAAVWIVPLEDTIRVKLTIQPDGSVSEAEILEGKFAFLRDFTAEAFRRWRWEPAADPAAEPILAMISIPFSRVTTTRE